MLKCFFNFLVLSSVFENWIKSGLDNHFHNNIALWSNGRIVALTQGHNLAQNHSTMANALNANAHYSLDRPTVSRLSLIGLPPPY